MARGKHTAQSAIRRAEAAHEHIDRLTDDLVAAKERARRFESDAKRVPMLEAELAKLRQHVANNTSHQLDQMRDLHQSRVAALLAENDRWRALLAQVAERMPRDCGVFTEDDVRWMASVRAGVVFGGNRETTRWRRGGKINHGLDIQDNRRTVDENSWVVP